MRGRIVTSTHPIMINQPIKIVIVDDHEIIRQGLVNLLHDEPALVILGQASDGQEAISLIQTTQPDVVLLDIKMEGMNGLEAIPHILTAKPDTKIIMLTMYGEDNFFFTALGAGAVGYFLKGSDSQELVHAIQTVHAGHIYLSPKLAQSLIQAYQKQQNLPHIP